MVLNYGPGTENKYHPTAQCPVYCSEEDGTHRLATHEIDTSLRKCKSTRFQRQHYRGLHDNFRATPTSEVNGLGSIHGTKKHGWDGSRV